MKIVNEVAEVTLSNVTSVGEFKIRNSAKAFSILSSGLYSNKIKAIIRELSCNAVDSMVAAGKGSEQFVVHLPTALEPWFSVKDFGTGLDDNQVRDIYTTYFESTKTDSNDFIGALGLGSKSPFSYTENFTVTAIKDGYKRIYSAFINENGIPSVAEMSVELTDEPNGVEVKFSVISAQDHQSFRAEAEKVFKWFKNKPLITGVSEFKIGEPKYADINIIPGVHLLSFADKSYAIMGNICYPIHVPEPEKHFGALASMLKSGLVIEFNIGELDFAASREELSYVSLTINSIKTKLTELHNNTYAYISKNANEIRNLWARADYLQKYASNVYLYKAAVQKYVTDTKFPLYDCTRGSGLKEIFLSTADLEARGFHISSFRVMHNVASIRPEILQPGASTPIKGRFVPISNDVIFVLNDTNTGCLIRAKHHFRKNGSRPYVFCISHASKSLSERQQAYNELLKELYDPPCVIKASELEKVPSISKSVKSVDGIMEMVGESWIPHREEIVDTEKYYYVSLSGYQVIKESCKEFEIITLRRLLKSCGVPGLERIKIFGVRKSCIDQIKNLPNWVPLEVKIKEEVATISDANIASLVATDCLDGYYTRVYTNKQVLGLIRPDSYYATYVNTIQSIPRSSGDVQDLVTLCKKYGKSLQVDAVKAKINNAKAKLLNKYPMLKFVRDTTSDPQVIAEYINIIDSHKEHQ